MVSRDYNRVSRGSMVCAYVLNVLRLKCSKGHIPMALRKPTGVEMIEHCRPRAQVCVFEQRDGSCTIVEFFIRNVKKTALTVELGWSYRASPIQI